MVKGERHEGDDEGEKDEAEEVIVAQWKLAYAIAARFSRNSINGLPSNST